MTVILHFSKISNFVSIAWKCDFKLKFIKFFLILRHRLPQKIKKKW